jgi:hypothetical protein
MYLSYAGNSFIFFLCALFFVLSLFVVPALHEGGHVLAGKRCGMRVSAVAVGFLRIEKRSGKFSVRFLSPFSEEAGECLMYPSDDKDIRKKFMCYSAGGVILQLVYFVIALALVLIFQNHILWATLGMTLPYCLYMILLNALPFNSGMGASDGEIFFGLLRRDPSEETLVNIFTVQGYLAQGYTPSEAPEELYFDLPQLPEDDGNFALLQLWRYYYYLDKGEFKKAQNALCRVEDCTEYIPEGYLPTIYAELTYVYCILKPDKESAEMYYSKMQQYGRGVSPQGYRASVAFVRLQGESAQAEEKVEEELSGMRKLEERLLAKLTD